MAQYGLSHYSKNITEPSLKQRLLEDGDQVAARWQVPNGAYIKRNVAEATSMVVEFNSRGYFYLISTTFRMLMCFNIFLFLNRYLGNFIEVEAWDRVGDQCRHIIVHCEQFSDILN